MMTVEIKLRFANELMKWEDRKVHISFNVIPGNYGLWVEKISREPISKFVSSVGKTYGAIETRWNFKDVDQGHYNFI